MKDESRQAAVRIALFGGPRVRVGGAVIDRFPTRHGAPITRDDIADTLWPDEALDASRRRIREHLYRLRNAIPDGRELILTEGDFILLAPQPPIMGEKAPQPPIMGESGGGPSLFVDALEFDKLLKRATETDDADRKVNLLVEADALYTGPFAPELDWPRFDGMRTRYAGLHLELLRALSLLFAESDFKRAIEYGKGAVAADPLCEGAHEELIRLYVRAGRPEEARRQYRELEKTLRKELGTEPSREITQFIMR